MEKINFWSTPNSENVVDCTPNSLL